MTRLTTLNLPGFHKQFIGFDNLFDQMDRVFVTSEHAKKSLVTPIHQVKMENDDNIYTIKMQNKLGDKLFYFNDISTGIINKNDWIGYRNKCRSN